MLPPLLKGFELLVLFRSLWVFFDTSQDQEENWFFWNIRWLRCVLCISCTWNASVCFLFVTWGGRSFKIYFFMFLGDVSWEHLLLVKIYSMCPLMLKWFKNRDSNTFVSYSTHQMWIQRNSGKISWIIRSGSELQTDQEFGYHRFQLQKKLFFLLTERNKRKELQGNQSKHLLLSDRRIHANTRGPYHKAGLAGDPDVFGVSGVTKLAHF